ncbi:Flp pilus assembly protein CpaB [Agaricicola taiwanensis]|uniref:Flp pilus assembly protein CpaB n=1 Tax=Agaricicola taiwanensis TaxID=591372 RepID=A0A8J2VMS0_9RHOB|nr:Flp pilus assembly protein CpaB [Agaricicola taiwanensis]GGE33184.1 Flp pilus assembly protein CpaB [Agaricicola taiwanensis]
MRGSRLLVLGVAIVAGGAAALLSRGGDAPAPVVVKQEAAAPAMETTKVLVAGSEIPMGSAIKAEQLTWRTWPSADAASFIKQQPGTDQKGEYVGAIARQSFVAGEPINDNKLIKSGSGFMSAILPSGMRAIATEISAETGAGGFILPNDRVDVLLTRRENINGVEQFVSSTLLTNVRTLAIDQTVEDQNGKKVVVGRTATLELLPKQAEALALSRQLGTISLALRPMVDTNPEGLVGGALPQFGEALQGKPGEANRLNVVRYGVTTQAVQ